MKIWVCIKQVPDTETKIKLNAGATGIDSAGVKWVVNPYDEFAIEEAVKLREAGKATQVFVVTVGPKARASEALRTALAMGADEAVVIDANEQMDFATTAKVLAAAIKQEGDYGMVFCGKLAIDDNSSSVPQMLAENLGIPHATVISKLTLEGTSAIAERETEGGSREIIQVQLPAVIAANKGLNLPRYASLPGIMKAKKKTIKELSAEALGATANLIEYTGFKLPAEKPAVKMLAGAAGEQAAQLAKLLREEAKVI